MAKYINIQVPLVELSSDSENEQAPVPQAPAPAAPPAASHSRSVPRTPRYHPTVSDDASSEPPARVPSISRGSPVPPARRFPDSRPRSPAPARIPTPPAPRVHHQARMSVGPRPTHQLAARDFPAVPFPRSTYEHGESSRQPDYGHQISIVSAGLRDARYSVFHLQDHMSTLEAGIDAWRQVVDTRAQALTDELQRNYEEYRRRTSSLERMMIGAVVLAVAAVVVAFVPYFFPRV